MSILVTIPGDRRNMSLVLSGHIGVSTPVFGMPYERHLRAADMHTDHPRYDRVRSRSPDEDGNIQNHHEFCPRQTVAMPLAYLCGFFIRGSLGGDGEVQRHTTPAVILGVRVRVYLG